MSLDANNSPQETKPVRNKFIVAIIVLSDIWSLQPRGDPNQTPGVLKVQDSPSLFSIPRDPRVWGSQAQPMRQGTPILSQHLACTC